MSQPGPSTDLAMVGEFVHGLPYERGLGLLYGLAHKAYPPKGADAVITAFDWQPKVRTRMNAVSLAASLAMKAAADKPDDEPPDDVIGWHEPTPPSEHWTLLELMLSPLAATEVPRGKDGRVKGNAVDVMSHALFVWADVDVAERRDGDRRKYVPSVAEAVDRLDYCTHLIDTGGGVAGLIMFDIPVALDDEVKLLRLDLLEHTRQACAPFEFDSPPSWGWLKVPGSWSRWRQRQVSLIRRGAPVSWAEARRRIPRYDDHPSVSRPYVGQWGPGLEDRPDEAPPWPSRRRKNGGQPWPTR